MAKTTHPTVTRLNVAADILKLQAKLEEALGTRKSGRDRTAIAALKDARDSLLAGVD